MSSMHERPDFYRGRYLTYELLRHSFELTSMRQAASEIPVIDVAPVVLENTQEGAKLYAASWWRPELKDIEKDNRSISKNNMVIERYDEAKRALAKRGTMLVRITAQLDNTDDFQDLHTFYNRVRVLDNEERQMKIRRPILKAVGFITRRTFEDVE